VPAVLTRLFATFDCKPHEMVLIDNKFLTNFCLPEFLSVLDVFWGADLKNDAKIFMMSTVDHNF